MRKLTKKEWIPLALRAGIWAAVTVVFLLLFSISTSPLTNEYGTDSSFFVLVAQGMTRGMLPYRDFFDMKGPYLFLIEYIGQLFRYGKVGAICVQCFNLFFTLCIMDMIFLMQTGWSGRNLGMELLCTAPVLLAAMVSFDGGNLTEEYALPWLMLAVYFALGYLKKSRESGDWKHPVRIGFYYGFAFGFLAMIRITNAAAIGAVILTICVGLLVKNEWKNLLSNGMMFIAGCAAALAPACIFFACHGLLGQMLTQVFLFGFRYSEGGDLASKIEMLCSDYMAFVYLAMLPAAVLLLYRVRDWCKWLLAASAFAIFLAAVLMGNVYVHYFTLCLPNVVLAMAFWLEEMKLPQRRWDLKKAVVIVLAALCFLPMSDLIQSTYETSDTVRYWKSIGAGRWKRDYCLDIAARIPEDERDSVYAYGMATYGGGMFSCANFYVQAQLLPSHRYCDWQEHYIELNPQVGDELAAWLAEENPKWVVVPVEYEIAPEQIAGVIRAHYHEYERNDIYILYAANGNTQK